jgi:hypothetical protein
MLGSILRPVVHGPPPLRTRRRWLGLAALHSLGTVAAAAALGGALTALAWALRRAGGQPLPAAAWLGALVALVYLPRQLGWARRPRLLQSRRQVPQHWAFLYPPGTTALLYGLGLGSGLYTAIIVPTFYLLLVWPFLAPGSLWPLLTWACYGLVRSAPLWWLAWTAPLDDPIPHATRLTFALVRHPVPMHRANGAVLGAAAAWLLLRSLVS